MTSVEDLDTMQTYHLGRADELRELIATVKGPGSRAFREQLQCRLVWREESSAAITRDLLAARALAGAAKSKAGA